MKCRVFLSILQSLALALPASSAFAAAPSCGDVFDVEAPDFWQQVQDTSAIAITKYNKMQMEFRLRWGRNFDPDMSPISHIRKNEHKEALWKSMAVASNYTMRTLINADAFLIKSEVGKVLEKIYDDPKAPLTAREDFLIRKHRLVGFVEKQRKFSIENPHWRKIRTVVNSTTIGIMTMGLVLALDHAIDPRSQQMTFDDYIQKMETETSTSVHLLTETAPFTQSSIRIGSKVYSYASGLLSVTSVRDYFKSHNEIPRDAAAPTPGIYQKLTTALTEKMGANRTVRFLELRLNDEELQALRRDLDANLGKVYSYISTVSTDSTMLLQLLKRNTRISVPDFVDAYANLSDSILWISNDLGGEFLGHRGVLTPEKTSGPWVGFKSFLTDYLESRTLVASASLSYPTRIGLDFWNTEAALQWWDPVRSAEVKKWKEQSTHQIESILQQENFSLSDVAKFLESLEKKVIDDLKADQTNPMELIKAQAKLEAIAKMKKELKQ